MLKLRAHVENGRVIVDDPVDPQQFPDGMALQIVPEQDEDEDELEAEDLARLHEALDRSEAELARGEKVPVAEAVARLRAGR